MEFEGNKHRADTGSFQIYLNAGKVVKGCREVRHGVFTYTLGGLTVRREVGQRWQHFGKKWIRPVEVQKVEVELKLLNAKSRTWQITGPKTLLPAIQEAIARRFA